MLFNCFAASSDWFLKHLLNQSNNKTKPTATCQPAFSRAVYVYSSSHWFIGSLTPLTCNYFGLINKTQGKTTLLMSKLTHLKDICLHGKYNSKPAGLRTAKIRPRKYEHTISHHAFIQLHFFVKCTRRDKLNESEDNAIAADHFDALNQSEETCYFINQSRNTILFSRAYLTPVTRHIFPRLELVARLGCDFSSGFLNFLRFTR